MVILHSQGIQDETGLWSSLAMCSNSQMCGHLRSAGGTEGPGLTFVLLIVEFDRLDDLHAEEERRAEKGARLSGHGDSSV